MVAMSGWDFTNEKRSPGRGPAVTVRPLLIGIREAAQALGLSERTLWDLTKAGEIPHVRVGRRVLYDPNDLRAWVESLKKTPESPSLG